MADAVEVIIQQVALAVMPEGVEHSQALKAWTGGVLSRSP